MNIDALHHLPAITQEEFDRVNEGILAMAKSNLSTIPCEKCHQIGVCEDGMDIFIACLCQSCFDAIWAEYEAVMTRPKGEQEMLQCQFCQAKFASEDAYQIHLGIGAPAFHACNDATEMQAKSMTQNQAGEWAIDESLVEHRDNWTYLKEQSS